MLHDQRRSESSTVEIDYIKLWARIDGIARPIRENNYDDGKFGGQLCGRSPWHSGPCRQIPGQVVNGVLVVRPSDYPNNVLHPYLETWPVDRNPLDRADSVWIEARVRITGPALVHAGIDYWQSLDYPAGDRSEEAAVTDWVCSTGDWQILKLGRSTEVVGEIEVSGEAPIGPGRYRVGTPLTATFTVGNFDDNTVELAEIGVETRLMAPNDVFCDPKMSPDRRDAFGWMTKLALSPGESRRHSAMWVPTQPGRYCLVVVEKRDNEPYYRRTYLSRHRVIDIQ
ncbi:MAG TPA: hypothetical protein VF263_22445 [Longimicrobiaceae bacterium]